MTGNIQVPSRDCRVVLHCCSRSPGSDVGKKTAAGSPEPLPEKSSRKPTADRRACHPGTPPTFTRGERRRGTWTKETRGWKLKTEGHGPCSPRSAATCTWGYTGHHGCAATTSPPVEEDRRRFTRRLRPIRASQLWETRLSNHGPFWTRTCTAVQTSRSKTK